MMYFQLFIPMFNTSITTLRNSPYKTANRYCLQDTHTHTPKYIHTQIYMHIYIHTCICICMYQERKRTFLFFLNKGMRRKVTPLLLSKNNFPGSIIFKSVLNYSFNLIKTRNLSNTSEYNLE